MEKIKDFFHDFSDVFFAIIIASIMFAVLTINLGGWFNVPIHTVLADRSTDTSEEQNNEITDNQSNNNTDLKDDRSNKNMDSEDVRPDNSIDSESDRSEKKDDTSKAETKIQQDDNVKNSDTEEDAQTNKTIKETKKIIIPSGTYGTGIAKILQENELIDDINDFVRTAENLNLSRRLRSGSFEIPIDTTVENMVKIIAGQENM